MENLGKFKKGDAVKLHGGSYLITDLIGSGAVGEVYRAIDVQLSRLRRKLGDDPREPVMIRTVRGDGYLFAPSVLKI